MQMLHVLVNTILPVFSIILLGYVLRWRNVLSSAFVKPANQIVYYVALPAMLLNTIARAPFRANFNVSAVACLLAALVIVVLLGVAGMRILNIPKDRRGTFVQGCFHGNIGYMSYAIAYYALGEKSFAPTAILSSFLIVAQNFLAVWALMKWGRGPESNRSRLVLMKHLFQNPIILGVLLGILFSALELPIPGPVRQGLEILSGMAFPTALLLIGASLSFGALRTMVKEMISIGVLKLLCLPLFGYLLAAAAHVPDFLRLPAVLLLAGPPATVTYVMAEELGGDPELAATSISVLTLLSAFTYSLFLSM